MNRSDIRKLCVFLSGKYPEQFKLDTEGVVLASWEHDLKNYTFEEAYRAVQAYSETGREYPPKPGQIVNILRRWAIQSEKIGSWEEGFFVAERIARQYGKLRPRAAAEAAKTISPRLYLVIRQFGYLQLCELFPARIRKSDAHVSPQVAGGTIDDIKFARIRFEKLWREFTQEIQEFGYIGHQQTLELESKAGFCRSSSANSLVQTTAKAIEQKTVKAIGEER